MPDINAMTLTLDTVDVQNIADGGFFKPAATPGGSLESLNGGLGSTNYPNAAAAAFPAWTFRYGTHCAAGFTGSNRREFVTRRQGGGNDSDVDSQRIVLAGPGSRFLLPWDAKLLMWGFSAWCCGDSTRWNGAGGPYTEHWDWKAYFDDTEIAAMYGRSPASRTSSDAPEDDPFLDDPGIAIENRWRYAAEFGTEMNVSAGYHKIHLSTWGAIFAPDQKSAKLVIPSWSMWVLAIR